MSCNVAISAAGLGKCYQIYGRPQDRLKQTLWRGRRRFYREFWALRDVSFQVGHGETVGIVGRNGSGKSTLLQLVAGTLTQTVGEIEVNGRIAALLELGAGFNPEFTGRENVQLNASLMGLSPDEIAQRYDEIVAFADIGDFIGQPVRTYSTGMCVRLAFAVAINVHADILIIDEALAVGDEAFQRKCFSRIQSLQKAGATILFVSHSGAAVVELCSRALLLDGGELLCTGVPKYVVSRYHKLVYAPTDKVDAVRTEIRSLDGAQDQSASPNALASTPAESLRAYYDPHMKPASTLAYESRGAVIENPRITTLQGEQVNVLVPRDKYRYAYQVYFPQAAYNVRFGMLIKTVSGLEVGGAVTSSPADAIEFIPAGATAQVQFSFRNLLNPAVYFLNAGVLGTVDGSEVFLHRYVDVAMIRVLPTQQLLATAIVDLYMEPEVKIEANGPNLVANT